jgi:hypothetical protein
MRTRSCPRPAHPSVGIAAAFLGVVLLCLFASAEVARGPLLQRKAKGTGTEEYSFYVDSVGDTVKHGIWKYRHPSGDDSALGYYRDGKRDSTWTEWAGFTTVQSHWRGGLLHGRYLVWLRGSDRGLDPTNAVADGQYVLGKREGPWRTYDEGSGERGEGQYISGLKVGVWREIHPSMRDIFSYELVGRCINGLREGWWTTRCLPTPDGVIPLENDCGRQFFQHGHATHHTKCSPNGEDTVGAASAPRAP